ncbi:PREDICTED: myb-like protein A [Camelina sativa]|uniref:Myb-like protein A n=1 Tax=Camelina sativa TaxID=90675 RepID=A0ABM0V4L2_CAMSA|nr:PREDICTED: myb-like protein A [Camelina sativa]
MKFSHNITNENFIFNEANQNLVTSDASYTPFYNKNLDQSSLKEWFLPPDLTDISSHHQLNPIPSIPKQSQDFLNQNLDNTQNHLVYNSPSYEVPSNYPFGHTLWDETVHNAELTKRVCVPALDQMMGGPRSFDVPVPESIKNTTREIMNQHEGQKMVKTYQKEKKKMVRTSKHSKKGNIIKAKAKWTESEDTELKKLVKEVEPNKWTKIAKKLKGRTGKQCRERWQNHLHPDIKDVAWSKEEDHILIELHKVVGTKWVNIAQKLPGRSPNCIKNHWNTTKRRVQKQSGENLNLAGNYILENYVRYVIINDNLSKSTETDGETTNTEDDDEYKDMFFEEPDSNMDGGTHIVDVRTQTIDAGTQTIDAGMQTIDAGTLNNEPLVNAPTTSYYVPTPEVFTWENYATELCEPVNESLKDLMQWWE